jgi:hypothetical protein
MHQRNVLHSPYHLGLGSGSLLIPAVDSVLAINLRQPLAVCLRLPLGSSTSAATSAARNLGLAELASHLLVTLALLLLDCDKIITTELRRTCDWHVPQAVRNWGSRLRRQLMLTPDMPLTISSSEAPATTDDLLTKIWRKCTQIKICFCSPPVLALNCAESVNSS